MRLTAPLAYAPRRGPLGAARPWIAAAFLMPLAVVAFTFANPIVLLAAGAAALIAGAGSGAGASVRGPLRWSIGLGVMVIAVNAIASQRGATILWRGWDLPVLGQIDVVVLIQLRGLQRPRGVDELVPLTSAGAKRLSRSYLVCH